MLLIAVLALAGCGAPTPTAPVKVMAMAITDGGVYAPTQVELKTIESVVELRGSAASLIGGARIVLDAADPRLQTTSVLTDQQLQDIFLKSPGTTVHGSYLETDGVFWPADFHTWNMATTYYNFELAVTYFQGTGQVPAADLNASKVYYFPNFIEPQTSPDPIQDNALFFSAIQGFVILPFNVLQKLPLAMNSGVLAHEFGHRVFNRRVHNGASLPSPLDRWITAGPTPAFNLLKSMEEGLADYHAVGASCFSLFGCNTKFLAASLGDALSASRDMGQVNHCMTTALRNALTTANTVDFSGLEYQVGTALSTALWQAGERAGQRQALQRAVLASYFDATPSTPGFAQLVTSNLNSPQNFTLGLVANTILKHIADSGLKREVCNQFLDHLQVRRAELPDCPSSATGGTTCPNIN